MFKRIIIIVSVTLLISGCCLFQDKDEPATEEITQSHPQLPTPVRFRQYNWVVVEVDGQRYISLPYNDFIDYLSDQQDVLRYIRESNAIICFYRDENDDLNDSICVDSD